MMAAMLPVRGAAEEWKSCDDATLSQAERIARSNYVVEIRREGSRRWKRVDVLGALVSNIDRRTENGVDTLGRTRTLMNFAAFTDDFKKPVQVRVTRRGAPFRAVEVRPSSYGIAATPSKDFRSVEFTLSAPEQKVSVEFDGDRDRNLFLFPDKPDAERPEKKAEDVIYYGPGEHHAGFITLRSGQTLYLDEGAVVYGSVVARDAEHIAIRGRGVLCGSRQIHDFDRRRSMFDLNNCTDVLMEGFVIRDSPSWTICLMGCRDVTLRNVKQICWARNSDGLDVCNSENVRMEDCFFRNYDDNISLKVPSWGRGGHVRGFTVRRSVLWADCAHNFLVGPESRDGSVMEDIHMQDCIILEGRETAYPWLGTMAVMISDEGDFRDIHIDNVLVDGVRGGMPFSFDYCTYNTLGHSAADIRVSNVDFRGQNPPKSLVRGLDAKHIIDGISFRNIRINGVSVTPENAPAFFDVNAFVEGFSISEE